MKTQFYILLSLKTAHGFVNYGQYFLGDDRQIADELFSQLKSGKDFNLPLHIDLMETVNELPVQIKTIYCSLEDVGANCKLITRELFRLKNLEEIT
ncbi:hypothetical protein AB6735_06860 [Mucilaginibacter sp. RCC_168]|uniref:hypothetical protein n=1 Tax=Mucilaginibacter sp. RCC_168 TaxID=3239221 RepID=UPI003525DDB2